MEYITAEQFLEQPEEVQQVLRDWWKDNISAYDLYKTPDKRSDVICLRDNIEYITAVKDLINDAIPLFTEGQLRKFIEAKTKGTIDLIYTHMEDKNYKTINKAKYLQLSCLREIIFRMRLKSDADIFKAYWQCALKIAKGEFKK